MKTFLIRTAAWSVIAVMLAYLLFGKEAFTLRFMLQPIIVIAVLNLVFTPKTISSIAHMVYKPKNKE
jgi:competence protein ComGC